MLGGIQERFKDSVKTVYNEKISFNFFVVF